MLALHMSILVCRCSSVYQSSGALDTKDISTSLSTIVFFFWIVGNGGIAFFTPLGSVALNAGFDFVDFPMRIIQLQDTSLLFFGFVSFFFFWSSVEDRSF